MRKTTHSTSHSLTAAGHEAPGRSVAPARVQPRFPNHEGLRMAQVFRPGMILDAFQFFRGAQRTVNQCQLLPRRRSTLSWKQSEWRGMSCIG